MNARKVKTGFIENERGIALIITVTIITLLMTAVLALNRKVRSDAVFSAVTRDRTTLRHVAGSGIQIAMAILVEDKLGSSVDSVQEDWADPQKLSELVKSFPFDGAELKLRIRDELGKIQVNALVQQPDGHMFNLSQQALWLRLLGLFTERFETTEEIDPLAIINAAKDWMDTNDDDAVTGLSGAESDYYLRLDPPYPCRNGPLLYLDELLLIKDFPVALYHGIGGEAGISEYVTVYGMTPGPADAKNVRFEGRININTAPVAVLAALLPVGSQELALEMDAFRREMSDGQYVHDLAAPTWYQSVPGLDGISIDPNLITTSSDVFKIEASASLKGISLTGTAIVVREIDTQSGKWHCNILWWETR